MQTVDTVANTGVCRLLVWAFGWWVRRAGRGPLLQTSASHSLATQAGLSQSRRSQFTGFNIAQHLWLPGNLLSSIPFQFCAPVPGVSDGGLRHNLHNAPRLFPGAGQERV